MNTLYFRYAIEVERSRSITQAAEHLYMAQPNLSKAIKELEEMLGIEIFQRTSKGVIPTKKGSQFLAYARNVLAQIDKMQALSQSDSSTKQSFNLSFPRGSYISQAFTLFVAELDHDKEIELNIQETNSMQTINNVAKGSFSMGIIRYQNIYENYFKDYLVENELESQPIWEYDVLALMSENCPYANANEFKLEMTSRLTQIIHGDNTIPYIDPNIGRKSTKSESLYNITKRIYVYERCTQFDLLSAIPSTFMWVSPIPQIVLDRYKLVQRKCEVPNSRYKDVLIYQKGYEFSGIDKLFIDKLFEAKNEVAFKEYN
ncbi:MAG: LysR family transcriptional regulator [Clostridiales bacterium]|nr:LysR family transcriptional regulator [Clostridiales bacterium]